jgi:acyl dehydratase
MIDGVTAARWGLVSHAVPAAELDGAVEALVARLARHSGEALARMKRMYRDCAALPAPQALAAERAALVEHLMTSPAAAEGLAAFRAGRKPDFSTVHSPLPGGAMTRTDEGRRAVSGRWFEELEVGTVVQHVTRRTVTETDNVLFTTMTMNPAPLHLDADYAAGTEFGRPLVNSMFTLALVVGLSVSELTLGTIVAQLGLTDVAFPAPVFPGDTIRVETEVVEARASRSRADAGIVVFEHRAHNQRDELVCRARRTGLMHRRPIDSMGTQS